MKLTIANFSFFFSNPNYFIGNSTNDRSDPSTCTYKLLHNFDNKVTIYHI